MTPARVTRYIALALPALATAFFGLMVIGSAFSPGDFSWEGLAVVAALIVLGTSTVIAWRSRRWAGPALIMAAAIFATIIATTAGSNVLLVTVLLPLPWLVGGLVLLITRAGGDPEAG